MVNNNNSFKASFKERKKERNKTVSNRVEEESYKELLGILKKERLPVGDWLQGEIDSYVKVHGDGNPSYTLDHYDDIQFLATPAYHRPIKAWESYVTKCSDKHYKEWCSRLDELMNLESRITKTR